MTSNTRHTKQKRQPKPSWLKVRFPAGTKYNWIRTKVENLQLSTVCEEARCPNIGECWNGGTATFMVMGEVCTRGCRFCSVQTKKKPGALDSLEPLKLADTIAQMDLDYVVLTTVDRDDLEDQGANHIATCIQVIQKKNPDLLIESLLPDFRGDMSLVDIVLQSRPAVLAHNLETIERLTPTVRDPRATYQQSLNVLEYMKLQVPHGYTKSSLMLGLGESREEVITAMEDLRNVGVNFLTLGQYLQPTSLKLPVIRYWKPEEFEELGNIGEKMGFEYVASGPLVRSSYRAAEYFIQRKIKEQSFENQKTEQTA